MLDFRIVKNPHTGERWLETSVKGKPLLTTPQLNKGTAFTEEERRWFHLEGKLPLKVETLDEQVTRAYAQLQGYQEQLQKRFYLTNLHDTNQVLFYKLVSLHLEELLPVLYTPFVGQAIKSFSAEFRQTRGLYLAYPSRDRIRDILRNRTNPDIELVVVTDGERVLGIGDQGIGGMDIPIAKLMVYSLCGGIDPLRTLPILLDVGTNNERLLQDPQYLGWRHRRLERAEYDDFIETFVSTLKEECPNVFLHWEDFGRDNARRNLERYQDQICTFNDDMQGTGAVTLAALLAAVDATQLPLTEQRIVIMGGGTAGTGIADQIVDAMVRLGLPKEEAYARFWMIDKPGLLHEDLRHLTPHQTPYAKRRHELLAAGFNPEAFITLEDTVSRVKPTTLIGCSSVPGAFNEAMIRELAKSVAQPIIFPLSNPNQNCEAQPEQLLQWTQGRALVATGSPFGPVVVNGQTIPIAQCNNALVFPGIGLGILASGAKRLSDQMLWAACNALSQRAPIRQQPSAALLPPLQEARSIAQAIALAVGLQAQKDGVAPTTTPEVLAQRIQEHVWEPAYLPLKPIEA